MADIPTPVGQAPVEHDGEALGAVAGGIPPVNPVAIEVVAAGAPANQPMAVVDEPPQQTRALSPIMKSFQGVLRFD